MICERGTGAAPVLPACNSEAMQLHLDEIATKVVPGAHAILILDQAGWHGAKELRIHSILGTPNELPREFASSKRLTACSPLFCL